MQQHPRGTNTNKKPTNCKASTRCSLGASAFPFARCPVHPTTPQGSKCLSLSYFVSHLCTFLYSAFILVPPSILVPYITLTAWPRAGRRIELISVPLSVRVSVAPALRHHEPQLCRWSNACPSQSAPSRPSSHTHTHTHTLSLSLSLSAGGRAINTCQSATSVFTPTSSILSNSRADYPSAI